MPQHLRYLFGAHPILQGEDGAGVPKVREADMIQPGLLDDLIVHPAHHLGRVGPLCGRVHEHERATGVPGVFRAQKLYNFLGQADGPGAASILHQLPPLYRAALRDGQRPLLYIQVAPSQCNQLALPKPRRQRQQEHGEVAQPLGRVQIVLHLCWGQHIGTDLFGLWIVECTGGIVRYQAVPDGLIQALLEQAVDMPHGVFAQPWVFGAFRAVAAKQPSLLQKIAYLLCGQLLQRDLAQPGKDMVLEEIPMGGVGGGAALVLVVDLLPVEDILFQ